MLNQHQAHVLSSEQGINHTARDRPHQQVSHFILLFFDRAPYSSVLAGILFNGLNEHISCDLTLSLNEKHTDLTCFLATAFDKKKKKKTNDVFVFSFVLGVFSGKSLELKHPL